MILYHGSYTSIEKPDLSFSRHRTDFGKGYYLTPIKEQAESWAERFRRGRGAAILSVYSFLHKAGDTLPPEVQVLEFDTHNMEWLDFITACRLGHGRDAEWDLVIGGVANDKVFDTIQLYFDGLIDGQEAIGRLRYNKPNFQYCFKSQALIDKYLLFVGSEVL
jgi:hypothetical protein